MKVLRRDFAIALFVVAASMAGLAQTQPAEIRITDGPIPIRVLAQSPADSNTELQVICLFRSDPANALHGSLLELNEKLKGILDRIRNPTLFRGDLAETLLLTPPPGTIAAKKLLIVGLGDFQSFTPERMELVGSVVFREAGRLGAAHPFFAPTLLDGGMTKYTTGQISEQVIRGFLRAAATQKVLDEANAAVGGIQNLTFLAGAKNAASTQQGIEKAIAVAAGK